MPGLQKLGHHLLKHIFSFLPVCDLIYVEAVHEDWKNVVREYWDTAMVLSVDVINESCNVEELEYVLKNYMRTKVGVVYRNPHTNQFKVGYISNYLPYMKVLCLPALTLTAVETSKLLVCHKLIHLCIQVTEMVPCEMISQIYKNNTQLRNVSILGHRCENSPPCIEFLPESCSEYLKLTDGEHNLQAINNWDKVGLQNTFWDNLKALHIINCEGIDHDFIEYVIRHLRVLSHLIYNVSSSEPFRASGSKLSVHRDLKSITLINNKSYNNEMLNFIATYCVNLNSFIAGDLPIPAYPEPEFSNPHTVKESSMCNLASKEYLRRISLYNITGSLYKFNDFKNLFYLQILEFVSRHYHFEDLAITAAAKCMFLRHITVLGTYFTFNGLKKIQYQMILRDFKDIRKESTLEEKLLTIVIEEQSVTKEDVVQCSHPFLDIVMTTVEKYAKHQIL